MFGITILEFTFDVIWLWLGIVIWVFIALWPARVAARKGRSAVGFFIFSLFFFPLALLVAYLVSDRSVDAPPAAPTEE